MIGLERVCRERNVKLILVDSAALACGGDPKEEHVATAYFNALAKLGIASLTVAHMTKDEKDDHHPYGSIFFHNSARMTWNIKVADEDENPRHLGLYCRKANEDMKPKPLGVCMTFSDAEVTINKEELVQDLTIHLSATQQVRRLLLRGAKTKAEICEETGLGENTVKRALQRIRDAEYSGSSSREGKWRITDNRVQYPDVPGDVTTALGTTVGVPTKGLYPVDFKEVGNG